jgi:hypothetical protein
MTVKQGDSCFNIANNRSNCVMLNRCHCFYGIENYLYLPCWRLLQGPRLCSSHRESCSGIGFACKAQTDPPASRTSASVRVPTLLDRRSIFKISFGIPEYSYPLLPVLSSGLTSSQFLIALCPNFRIRKLTWTSVQNPQHLRRSKAVSKGALSC